MDNKPETVSLIPLGGVGDVTKNMYVYEYKDEMLIVDCGLGFADETMLGVDLLLPDISYVLQSPKKIVGLLFSHGHEDHIGALPFLLPQLQQKQQFPLFGSPLTAALLNGKLKEFQSGEKVKSVPFKSGEITLGSFTVSFIHVTHSVPDTSHIFIKTPIGNFYHGSDFKLDPTPFDNKPSDIESIKEAGEQGILCTLSDCLGAEKKGRVPTEQTILAAFENEMKQTQGKFIVTTYSSNIARLNQIIVASQNHGRKVCFIGRSLLKAKEVAEGLGYIKIKQGLEVTLEEMRHLSDHEVTLVVAGSQGQENSALARIVNGEHREVKLSFQDTVVFSADPIPGNEVTVYSLIDSMAKRGVRVVYSDITSEFHVSGHGARDDLKELISYTKPKMLLPIGGTYRHMAAYRQMAGEVGYKRKDVLFLEDGQEVLFSKDGAKMGRMIKTNNVYVDEVSGEELEHFVLRDRQRLSEGGVLIVLSEVESSSGQLVGNPDIVGKGFVGIDKKITDRLSQDIRGALRGRKGRVTNWVYIRKQIGEVVERRIFKDLRRRPLILPIVIEV